MKVLTFLTLAGISAFHAYGHYAVKRFINARLTENRPVSNTVLSFESVTWVANVKTSEIKTFLAEFKNPTDVIDLQNNQRSKPFVIGDKQLYLTNDTAIFGSAKTNDLVDLYAISRDGIHDILYVGSTDEIAKEIRLDTYKASTMLFACTCFLFAIVL